MVPKAIPGIHACIMCQAAQVQAQCEVKALALCSKQADMAQSPAGQGSTESLVLPWPAWLVFYSESREADWPVQPSAQERFAMCSLLPVWGCQSCPSWQHTCSAGNPVMRPAYKAHLSGPRQLSCLVSRLHKQSTEQLIQVVPEATQSSLSLTSGWQSAACCPCP